MPQIELPKAKIAESCRQRHIRKLALYGSVLREVDLLGRDVIARSDNSTRRRAARRFWNRQRLFMQQRDIACLADMLFTPATPSMSAKPG